MNALDKYVLLENMTSRPTYPCVRPNPCSSASMLREFLSSETSSEDKYALTENLIISPLIFRVQPEP